VGEALTPNAAAALREILSGLSRVRGRWRLVELAEGAALWSAILCSSILGAGFLQLLVRGGAAFRLLLLLGLLAAGAGFLVRGLLVPALRTIRDEAVARRVELEFPELRNALINAIQLAADEAVPSRALASAAIIQSCEAARGLPMARAVGTARLRRLAAVAAIPAAALAAALAVAGPAFANALAQIASPFSFVPTQGRARILSVRPGDKTVRAGEQVPIEVEIAEPRGSAPEGRLFWRLGRSTELARPLTPVDRTHYASALSAEGEILYRVEIGSTQSRLYRLVALERAAVSRVDVELLYPDYTSLEPARIERAVDEQLDIRAPVGTVVTFVVTANRPVESAFLELSAGGRTERVGMELAPGRLVARGSLRLAEPGERRYAIRLADAAGVPDDAPVAHRLVALDDEPPRVAFVAPARRLELKPGDSIKLALRATDDYGLERVEVRYRRNKEGTERVLRTWDGPALGSRRDAALACDWRLDPAGFSPGDLVTYWAVARDRVSSRAGESARWEINIVDAARKARDREAALAALLKAVEEIVALQESARETSRALAARRAQAGAWREAVSGQLAVRERTLRAVAESDSPEADVAAVRGALGRLASGEMARAVVLAERLASGATEASPEALDASQARILEQLRRLLGALPRAIERALREELAEEEGSDLPDSAAEKLKELAEQLKEFMNEQRKVIADTLDLAKIPVADFSERDRAAQEALAAVEEKWEKFLKEAASDLSKLPKQDFSSEQLLQELIEVYSEVEMAKDALKQKAAEIAVPIEQAGLELAETLTTHIEKWLPDTPDRDKWSMEEPLGQYETPMAELPKELEDIVGELMEEAEDCFEEMEDVTSSWGDSIDKGAGWDAMDGPISNMSAQGVTGNRLPNSSEIGGRSGEGRTGKAAGEFVEETATGKGGRRTPTRLTPDAFLGGEVKDLSKDPAGGSTGGGKVSGAGGAGLEGPVPPELERQMERLKGAQASLRNKAERVAMELRARDFPEAEIELTLKSLRAMEADLKDGRYSNIARTRDVLLQGLERSREFVEGAARVDLDRSKGPEGLDQELGSVRDEVDPAGYEELLRAYREALRKAN